MLIVAHGSPILPESGGLTTKKTSCERIGPCVTEHRPSRPDCYLRCSRTSHGSDHTHAPHAQRERPVSRLSRSVPSQVVGSHRTQKPVTGVSRRLCGLVQDSPEVSGFPQRLCSFEFCSVKVMYISIHYIPSLYFTCHICTFLSVDTPTDLSIWSTKVRCCVVGKRGNWIMSYHNRKIILRYSWKTIVPTDCYSYSRGTLRGPILGSNSRWDREV